jgi:hypothetical protein
MLWTYTKADLINKGVKFVEFSQAPKHISRMDTYQLPIYQSFGKQTKQWYILFWLPTGKNLPQNKTRSCITGSRDNSKSNQNYSLNNKQKNKMHAWCQFSVINSTVLIWVHLFIESAKYIQAQGRTSIWSYSYYSQPHSSLDKSIVNLQLASPL